MKRLVGALLAFLAAVSAGAEPKVVLETGTGLVYGLATELVLRDGTYNDPVSRLQWPTPPAVAAEAQAQVNWTSWTATEVGFRSAWQLTPGIVVDEDWNAETASGPILVYGRSEHTGFLTALIEADAAQRLRLGSVELLAGGRYRWSSWESWNGTGTYEYSSGTSSNAFSGAVLDYRQMWFLPYGGLGLRWSAFGLWWNPEVRFGPYTWCLDRDDHNYAGKATKSFLDYPQGGLFGEVRFEVAASGWGLRWAGSGTWGAVGNTVATSTTQSANTQYGVARDGAGAWYWETSLTAFVRN